MTPDSPRPERSRLALPELPFAAGALEPYLSEETIRMHRRRQQAHLDVVAGESAPDDDASLEEILRTAPRSSSLYRSAAQCWNYAFLWQCIAPARGSTPNAGLKDAIARSFGGFPPMCRAFAEGAQGRFSSGWTWLAVSASGSLEIAGTNHDATLFGTAHRPLVVLDVWEFAFHWERRLMIDSRQARQRFVESCMATIVDWNFVSARWGGDPGVRTS